MATRHQRRLRGEEPFVDDDDPPRRTVLNQAELQVRESFERGRPKLDDATQALWDAYVDRRCAAIIDSKLEGLADVLGEASGEHERQLREDIRNLRGSVVREVRDELVKKFGDEYFNTMRNDVLQVLRNELRRDLGIASGEVIDIPNFKKA